MRTLALALCLLGAPVMAHAQGVGIFSRSNCDTIALPIAGATWCFDSTLQGLKGYTGTRFATIGTVNSYVVNVKDFGALGTGVGTDLAAFQAAISNNPGKTIYVPAGTYPMGTASLTVNNATTLLLGIGATITGSGGMLLNMDVDNNGVSSHVRGSGPQSIISYTGAGDAVAFLGTGQSSADPYMDNLFIQGTAAGVSGIHMKFFNRATIANVTVTGFTNGDGIWCEGANAITIINPLLRGNKNGLHNQASATATCNAIMVYGGQIRANSGWGIFEDATGGGGVGKGNKYMGVTLDTNGTNGSATSGHVFLQAGNSISFIGNYFESVTGLTPVYTMVLGDASNQPTSVNIIGNNFGSVGASATIANTNAIYTHVDGNYEAGAVGTFMVQGSGSRHTFMGLNNASAAGGLFFGNDVGADSYLFNATGTNVNALGTSLRGLAFNSISGLNQDLAVRTRGGGLNALVWQNQAGSQLGFLSDSGLLNFTGSTFTNLPGAADGGMVYCTDCVPRVPCAAGGTGAWAYRMASTWVCGSGPAGFGAATTTTINASATLANAPMNFNDLNLYLTANGMQGFCANCNIANPCTAGGTGAIAKRLNGIMVCN